MPVFLLVLTILTVTAIASFYLFRIVILRNRKNFLSKSPDLKEYEDIPPESRDMNWFESNGYETAEIVSSDGLKLYGYYARSAKSNGKAVLLVHGYSGRGLGMHEFARFYHEVMGYSVLAPDNRAHGRSEGKYIGFGWLDRRDLAQWINELIRLEGKDVEIVLHGISMGGAAVLMTSGEKLPDQVKAVISDCAYTSVKDELSYQSKRLYHLPAFPVLYAVSLLTKLRAGYFFGEASALEQVAKSRIPVLLIHGAADSFVPFEMMNRLYEAAQGPKEKLEIPGAGHGLARYTDSASYDYAVTGFLHRYVK